MWFCPARPEEFSEVDKWARTYLHHLIRTIEELNEYHRRTYGSFSIIQHNWWVPRQNGGLWVPTPGNNGNVQHEQGWPTTLDDPRGVQQPILTDLCGQPADRSPNLSFASRGHSFDGKVNSVNLLFTDGHVETRGRGLMQHRFSGNFHSFY